MKSIFQSKTFWFNVISGAVLFLGSDELKTLLGPDALRYVAAVVAALNIYLRMVTSDPVRVP